MEALSSNSRIDELPASFCDIVLKGGITSGVVYPLALVELSKKFRFSNIGGTSAGAIAAAAAAAAEYGRSAPDAGFERLAKIPNEIGPKLLSLFQPSRSLQPLFAIFIALLTSKSNVVRWISVLAAVVRGYPFAAIAGAVPGLVLAVVGWVGFASAGFFVSGIILGIVGFVVAIFYRLIVAIRTQLPANDFGLCPGLRQGDAKDEGFTDWLARLIDETAGIADGHAPLTFGALLMPSGDRPPIKLAMMTTSLMERRPYTLPLAHSRSFLFKRSEWVKLFPERVMTYLVENCERFEPGSGDEDDYYFFPDTNHLPVIVAARMSLSFPGLICAIPLWRRDFTYGTQEEQSVLRRCLFSDGGLSSNFPIHFFDRLLPNTPTFAISLDRYDEKRDRGDSRVWLPLKAVSGINIPVEPIEGILGFLMRLVDSAKDWQDNLQSTLPGYRERIVHIGLTPNEGGLNLAMDNKAIQQLADYGREAGDILCMSFDLDDHRWRRFLVAMARMEETLEEVVTAYETLPGKPQGFDEFLKRYANDPSSYRQDNKARLEVLLGRARDLALLGQEWRERPLIREGNIPKPDTDLRITPKP
ncbi:putative acylesterase/phospholipase RssA [Nitrobacteraceae bacterium AZCC 1564]